MNPGMPCLTHGSRKMSRSIAATLQRAAQIGLLILPAFILLNPSSEAWSKSHGNKRRAPASPDFKLTEEGPYGTIYAHAGSRSHLRFQKGFHRIDPAANPDIAYQFAYRHDRAPFEVRFHFAPLHSKKRKIEKGEVQADLDAPSPVLGQVLQLNMNHRLQVAFNPFPAEAVRREFGADWGYLSEIFPLDQSHKFNKGFNLGMISLVHRDGIGSWAVIFLASDIKDFEKLQTEEVFHSVLFQH